MRAHIFHHAIARFTERRIAVHGDDRMRHNPVRNRIVAKFVIKILFGFMLSMAVGMPVTEPRKPPCFCRVKKSTLSFVSLPARFTNHEARLPRKPKAW